MTFDISYYSSEYSESDTRIVRNIRWLIKGLEREREKEKG